MPNYQTSANIVNNICVYSSMSESAYIAPGVYGCYVAWYGDGVTTIDFATWLQISPDRGVTWWDWFIDSIEQKDSSTTAGTLVTGPIRDILKLTTEAPTISESPPYPHAFMTFTWPGGRIRVNWKMVINPAATQWLVGSTYALNDYVYNGLWGYRSLQNGNIGQTPPTTGENDAWWHPVRTGFYVNFVGFSALQDKYVPWISPPYPT